MSEKKTTYLEMTSPRQLRAASHCPAVALTPAAGDAPQVRELHDRVASPHSWASMYWSDGMWREWAARARHWIITVDAEPAGLTSVIAEGDGEVTLAVFGLAPEFIGHGHGGRALTLSVRAVWSMPLDPPVRRIWLHTSTADHAHALPNYLRRGFTVVRTDAAPAISDLAIFGAES